MNNRNPIVIFLYFAAAAGIPMFCMHPVIEIFALTGALSLFFIRNAGKKTGMHLPLFLLALLVCVLNPLFRHNGATVLFVINGNPVTAEAFLYGTFAAVMLLATLYWFRSFSQIMTSDKILYLFGRISPKLSLILSMALRYIPLFARQMQKTADAAKVSGILREDSAVGRIRGGIRTFSVTVTWALENGIVTADSMEARGYGEGKRSSFALFRFRRADAAFLSMTVFLFAVCLYGLTKGLVNYQYYPIFRISQTDSGAILTYGAYALLAWLPTLTEAGEICKWKYLQSKI